METPAEKAAPQWLLLMLLAGWDWLARRRLGAFFLASLVLTCGLVILAAPHRSHRWIEDAFLLLDGGWRILNGQRPYVDFYSGLGPVTYLLVAMGLRLSGLGPAGIDYGFAIAGLLLGIWAWLLVRGRSEAPAAFLLALFVVLTAISPHPMGTRPDILTYASVYNRLGYALVILAVAEALLPPSDGSARADRAGGFSSGAACSLAFFLKPTFFLVVAAAILSSYLFRDRRSAARTQGLAAGLAVVSGCLLLYLHFDVAAILSNLRGVVTARAATNSDPRSAITGHALLTHALDEGIQFGALLLLGLLVSILPRPAARLPRWADAWWPLAAACAVCAVEVAFLTTNGTQHGTPLTAAFALLLMSVIYGWWRAAPLARQDGYNLICALGMLLGLVLFVPQMAIDGASVVYAAAVSLATPPPAARFREPRLRDLLTRDAPPHWQEPANGRAVVDRVNDGTDLLKASSSPQETVFVVDWVNPFSYALARKPPAGGSPYLGGSIFNPSRMPSLDWLVGPADLVMEPRHPFNADVDAWMRQVFDGYVQTHYRLAAESYYWQLYRRNGMAPGR